MEVPYQPMSPEEEERELRRDIAELLSRRYRTSVFDFAGRRALSRQIAVSKARLNELLAQKKESQK